MFSAIEYVRGCHKQKWGSFACRIHLNLNDENEKGEVEELKNLKSGEILGQGGLVCAKADKTDQRCLSISEEHQFIRHEIERETREDKEK